MAGHAIRFMPTLFAACDTDASGAPVQIGWIESTESPIRLVSEGISRQQAVTKTTINCHQGLFFIPLNVSKPSKKLCESVFYNSFLLFQFGLHVLAVFLLSKLVLAALE
jgi:hypothetical protein